MRLTDEQRQSHRDNPAYGEGFYDAQDGEPLFNDATEPYRAGWEAYWVCREIFDRSGFTRTSDGSLAKTFTIDSAELNRDGGAET